MEAQKEPRVEREPGSGSFSPGVHTDPGVVVLCSKAYARDGAKQPESRRRNAIHRIEVKVD
jgi:hypothetical protein